MLRFVTFHDLKSIPITINLSHITMIRSSYQISQPFETQQIPGTLATCDIWLVNAPNYITVKETYEQVLTILTKSYY